MTNVVTRAQEILGETKANHQEHAEIIEILEAVLQEKQLSKEVDVSDEIWRFKTTLELKRNYIQAFWLLKSEEYYQAWCLLEQCEISLSLIKKNSHVSFQRMARLHFYEEYIQNWQSLFPYKIFFSPGWIVGHYTCSICDQKVRPRSSCEHEKKKLYCGKICFHIAHDIDLIEISLVKNPVQKYSVLQKDYDYTLVAYVARCLSSPFDGWQAIHSRKSYPREKFNLVADDAECPCKQLGKKFSECCAAKEQIEIPRIEVILAKKPENPEACCDVFPYESLN